MLSFTSSESDHFKIEPGTGNIEIFQNFKYIEIPFEKYIIKIKLTMDNKFIEIVEIRIKKDFLSFSQKMHHYGSHDVDEFYNE